MKKILIIVICLSYFSCENNHLKQETEKAAAEKITKPFIKRSFSLNGLESSKTLYDSLKNLPKLESSQLKKIIAKLNDSSLAGNMLRDPHYTFIRSLGETTVSGKKGVLIVRVTDYDSRSGKIYLLIEDETGNIILEHDLAEYYKEAGSSSYLSSVQISQNEFYQVLTGSDIKTAEKPDSLGVYESIGVEEYKVIQKTKMQNGKFMTTVISNTSRLKK